MDSLENHTELAGVCEQGSSQATTNEPKLANEPEENEAQLAIKSLQESALSKVAAAPSGPTEPTEPAKPDETGASDGRADVQAATGEIESAPEEDKHDVEEQAEEGPRAPSPTSSQQGSAQGESPSSDHLEPELEQPQLVQKNSQINNNNYSGLNLNMTASEMRELLARRKKFDPKKAQMNIRQKYEIIQQM